MPIEILMPALSPTMTEGNLAKWLVKEGDKITSGKVIAEIETDKATMEVECIDEGTVGKLLVPGGSKNVPVNKVIALLLKEGEDKKAIASWKPKEEPKAEAKADAPKAAGGTAAPAATGGGFIANAPTKAPEAPKAVKGERIAASPLAKKIADQKGIDLHRVHGTGPHGRVTKDDVDAAAAGTGGAVHRAPVPFTRSENSSMRQVIAKRLLEAKQQMPHFYLSVDTELDKLLEIRATLNGRAVAAAGKGQPAYKLSVNDFVIKAVALAMRDVPEANATWYDDAIVLYENVDVSIAVAIDGGLITPVIKNADQKTIPAISNEMKDLAGRARIGKLKPEEYQGGGFSISNLGMFGIKTFSAIINPPQSCILAVGAGEQRPVVRNGAIVPATVMTCTLSVDHRSVDGAVGANFLAAFKAYIEQPVTLFV